FGEAVEGQEQSKVTLSIGVAELAVGDDAVDWIKRADGALYHAKRAGRDTVSAAVS
ncbi:MAG: diguanylate cyclase, partial [Gemmatimonadaceae bacterium]